MSNLIVRFLVWIGVADLLHRYVVSKAEAWGASRLEIQDHIDPDYVRGPFEVLCSDLADSVVEMFPFAPFDAELFAVGKQNLLVDDWECGFSLRVNSKTVRVAIKRHTSEVRVEYSYPQVMEIVSENGSVVGGQSHTSDYWNTDLSVPSSIEDVKHRLLLSCMRALSPRALTKRAEARFIQGY